MSDYLCKYDNMPYFSLFLEKSYDDKSCLCTFSWIWANI